MEPVIKFKGYEIENINYQKTAVEKFDISNNIQCGINDDLTRGMVIVQTVINDASNQRRIEIIIRGFFEVDEKLKEKDEILNYLGVNGTAIIYPYVRTYASLLTSLDSESSIILPTINTQDFIETLDQ